MSNSIKRIDVLIHDKIIQMYEKYPFNEYGEPYLKKKLKEYGISENKIAYAECCDTTIIGYMYSIHRCAYMNHSHVENYIKSMVIRCIKIGVVLANKEKYELQRDNYKLVYLDDERSKNRF